VRVGRPDASSSVAPVALLFTLPASSPRTRPPRPLRRSFILKRVLSVAGTGICGRPVITRPPALPTKGSSKRYLRSFAAALRDEFAPWGVSVTCLAPGAVATGLYDQTAVPVERAVRYRVMKDPGVVARAGAGDGPDAPLAHQDDRPALVQPTATRAPRTRMTAPPAVTPTSKGGPRTTTAIFAVTGHDGYSDLN
jgi:NAD(P)-dependent dehydrogenase (short-subunit alcohol dehydrogenase family)